MSLRAELTGGPTAAVPPYRMLIPPGWEAYDLSLETESDLLARAAGRLTGAGRPDLTGQLTDRVRRSIEDLRRQSAFAYALPTEGAPTWALGAASLVGLKRVGTPELPLDEVVADAIARHGATPLGDDARIVRWAERRTATVDGERIATLQLCYIIPIPGSRRTQALQWVVNVSHDPDLAPDAPVLVAWEALFDVHVATFAWME